MTVRVGGIDTALRPRRDWALFLDVDGTLLDLAPAPEAVVVPDGLRGCLARLHAALGGALALISGRALADCDRLFTPLRLPVAGQHGAEIRLGAAGEARALASAEPLARVRSRVLEAVEGMAGVGVEDKGITLAVHFRRAPHHEGALRRILSSLVEAERGSLDLLAGKMIFDVRPRGADKGRAVEAFMRAAPFAGRLPVYVGDDVTDEDGFAAAKRLGGQAVRVGAGGGTPVDVSLADPAGVRDWLAALAERFAKETAVVVPRCGT
jgi:trehalose 6-phosphate phosphatase